MKWTDSATLICFIPWLLSGFPLNGDWYMAFLLCIIIDGIKYYRRRGANE